MGKQQMKPGGLLSFIGYTLRKNGLRTKYLTEVVEVHDGETLDLPGSPQIIGLPGHSAGSIAIFVPLVDAVFVGDGMTTRHVLTGKQGPQPAPFTDEPEQAVTSLRALLPTGAKWVLPGHGAPWSGGVAAAVAAVEAEAQTH
jgi:glyoxylase-like metal-dependent hydrolase (beta-lactamase superfamily II)